MEDYEITRLFASLAQGIGPFLLGRLPSLIVLWMAYRLLRRGLEKAASVHEIMDWHVYIKSLAPGGLFAILGLVLVVGSNPWSLMMYLLIMIVLAGLGFAMIGYRLFCRNVPGRSDVEVGWRKVKLLIKKAAPGTLFALFGLVMILGTLWKGPEILRAFEQGNRNEAPVSNDEMKAMMDRMTTLMKAMEQKREVKAAEVQASIADPQRAVAQTAQGR